MIKHSQSASKSRAAKDPHLEVCLKGKLLGDEGLEIACDGFRQALSSGGVKLNELNLAENALTVHGLKALGTVIQMAAGDLKDLDLSGNKLKVATVEEQQIWEEFLLSFRTVLPRPALVHGMTSLISYSSERCGDLIYPITHVAIKAWKFFGECTRENHRYIYHGVQRLGS